MLKMDEAYNNNWKPGGTMIGVYVRWGSSAETKGSDHMGRRSWVNLRGEIIE